MLTTTSYSPRHWTWDRLVNWTYDMGLRFGGIVYDEEVGGKLDWGQALARELYGPGWMNHEDFLEANRLEEWEEAPADVIELAERWENDPHSIVWAVYQR